MTTKKVPTTKVSKVDPKPEPLDYLKKKFGEICEESDISTQDDWENSHDFYDDGCELYFINNMLKEVYGIKPEFISRIDFVKV